MGDHHHVILTHAGEPKTVVVPNCDCGDELDQLDLLGKVQQTWRFEVPLVSPPPTANQRLHWAQRAKLVRDVRQTTAMIAQSERVRLGAPIATTKRAMYLTLIRGKRNHMMDADQVYAALKPVVDGLRDAGWIVDDTPEFLEYHATQRKEPVPPAVEVTVIGE